jgi:Ca2+-binding RTX toxin-like protein
MTDYTLTGWNRSLLAGTFGPDDTVTFAGTRGRDILFAGGGEGMATFVGTAGNDLYGVGPVDVEAPDWYLPLTVVDYGPARCSVYVDMTLDGGTRTFIDEHGETRTARVVGMASDGLGGVDSFAALPLPDSEDFSSVFVVRGSRFADTMTCGYTEAYGGAGNDRLSGAYLSGEEGDDFLWGTDDYSRMVGGTGDDVIFARGGDDGFVIGEAGDDRVDGGAGDDFIDGGVGPTFWSAAPATTSSTRTSNTSSSTPASRATAPAT